MNILDTNNLKQYLLLALILILALTLGWQLYPFFPGLLGAVTLYILLRQYYFRLTVIYNWKKWVTALVFILGAMLVFMLPLVALMQVLMPRITGFLGDPAQASNMLTAFLTRLHSFAPQLNITEVQISNFAQRLTGVLPTVLGATANMLTNMVLSFFLLYFMLVDGRKMERTIQKYTPLRNDNIDNIWDATRNMVVSNAIGIPLLAACQAVVAIFGYYIFGVESYILWGVLTGIFSVVPIVGTALVWVPLCLYLLAVGKTGSGLGLIAYSVLITGTVDNLLRFTILRKLGDVHPVITALGIIVGIPLFGFMGFIFGPLLLSYLLLLIKIYRVEFSPADTHLAAVENPSPLTTTTDPPPQT